MVLGSWSKKPELLVVEQSSRWVKRISAARAASGGVTVAPGTGEIKASGSMGVGETVAVALLVGVGDGPGVCVPVGVTLGVPEGGGVADGRVADGGGGEGVGATANRSRGVPNP